PVGGPGEAATRAGPAVDRDAEAEAVPVAHHHLRPTVAGLGPLRQQAAIGDLAVHRARDHAEEGALAGAVAAGDRDERSAQRVEVDAHLFVEVEEPLERDLANREAARDGTPPRCADLRFQLGEKGLYPAQAPLIGG